MTDPGAVEGQLNRSQEWQTAMISDNNNNNDNMHIYRADDQDVEDEENQSCGEIFCEEIKLLKWRVLIVACLITMGSYYIYDFPGSIGTGPSHTIQSRFKDHCKEYTQSMNLNLYAFYSWPNSVLAILGGLLIDKVLGLRKSLILFTVLITLGCGMMYLGVLLVNYPLLAAGRVIFAFGGESQTVAQSTLTARWFSGAKVRGLSVAFALTVAISRVGGTGNFALSPRLSNQHGVTTAFLFGFGLCVFSLLSCLLLVAMDTYGEKKGYVQEEPEQTSSTFSCKQFMDFPAAARVVSVITLCVYVGVFGFITVAVNFLEKRYGLTNDRAGIVVSLFQGLSAGFLPLSGLLVDKFGRRSQVLIFSLTLIGLTLLGFNFLPVVIPPELLMSSLSLGYAFMVAALWTTIPYICAKDQIGFAYGVMTAVQNFGLALFPMLNGQILDHFTETPTSATNSTITLAPAHSTPAPAHTTPEPAHTTPEPVPTTPQPTRATPAPAHTAVDAAQWPVLSGDQGITVAALRTPYRAPHSLYNFFTASPHDFEVVSFAEASHCGNETNSSDNGTVKVVLPQEEGYTLVLLILMGMTGLGVACSVILFFIDLRKDFILGMSSENAQKLMAQRDAEEEDQKDEDDFVGSDIE